jgi:hypothetical protein
MKPGLLQQRKKLSGRNPELVIRKALPVILIYGKNKKPS